MTSEATLRAMSTSKVVASMQNVSSEASMCNFRRVGIIEPL